MEITEKIDSFLNDDNLDVLDEAKKKDKKEQITLSIKLESDLYPNDINKMIGDFISKKIGKVYFIR